jgi:hypothetical protein
LAALAQAGLFYATLMKRPAFQPAANMARLPALCHRKGSAMGMAHPCLCSHHILQPEIF